MNLFWNCLIALPLLAAQVPRIGEIEIYGLHKVSGARIREALQLHTGDPLPASKGDVEERLERVPGVVLARLEAVCCEAGNAVLFVGIEEKNAPHFSFRTPAVGKSVLPQDILAVYRNYLAAMEEAGRRGSTAEDLTHGNFLMADPAVRKFQDQFASFAGDNLEQLRDVLRNSSEEEQRAIAAVIIGYAPDKRKIVADLEYAIQDPDEPVRDNAIHSLNAIIVLAHREPARGIRVSPTWFVEMLNSIVLNDRVRASATLVNLTDGNPADVLAQLRERALGSLVEMAQWKELDYALPPYILMGRIGGLSEQEIQDTWSKGQRAEVIYRILSPGRKKPQGSSAAPPDRR